MLLKMLKTSHKCPNRLQSTNRFYIFSQFIYPSPEASNDENGGENHGDIDGKYEHFTAMNNVVIDKVKKIMEEESSEGTQYVLIKCCGKNSSLFSMLTYN